MATVMDDSNIKSQSTNHSHVVPLPRKMLPNPPCPPVAQRRKSMPKPSKSPLAPTPDALIDEEDASKNCKDTATKLSENSDTLATGDCEPIPGDSGDINSNQTTDPAPPIEPPYASINKSSMRKKSSSSKNPPDIELDAKQVNDFENTQTACQETLVVLTPPPIPESRPPPEDYQEIFSPKCEDTTTEKKNVTITESDDDGHSNESPYEQVGFNNASFTAEDTRALTPPVVKRTKPPPPKPKMRPPPLPPSENNDLGSSNELKPPSGNGNTAPVAKRENRSGASKGINIIKRKSLNFTKKSIQIFKHHNTDDNKDNANAASEATKTNSSKSAPPSKAKSFSFPHRKDTTSQTDSTATTTKPINLSRHQSTPGRTDKPKRVPPPRPAMPTVLQNRLLSPTSPPEQKKVPLSSNKPDLLLSPVFFPDEERHVKIQDETFSYPESTYLDGLNDSMEKPSQLPLSPIKQKKLSSLSEDLSSPNTNMPCTVDNDLSEMNSKPVSKPARPPPMKKSPNKKKDGEEDKEKKESFFDVIKSTDNKNKEKVQVDEQMKHYITDESYYVATQDYQPVNFTDLAFTTGEKILVLKRIDDNLLFGRNEDGEEGPFPEEYVRLE